MMRKACVGLSFESTQNVYHKSNSNGATQTDGAFVHFLSVSVGRPPGVRPVLHLGRQCAQRANPFHVRIQLLNKKGPRPIMPAAMSHAGTMPAPTYNAGFRKYHSSCWRTHQPAGTHASTQKMVGLEFDHVIAAPVVMPAHLPAYKKMALDAIDHSSSNLLASSRTTSSSLATRR